MKGEKTTIEAIQYTGGNLMDVLEFTGRNLMFGEWFPNPGDFERYVAAHGGIFKIFHDGWHWECAPGTWIVRTPDGCCRPVAGTGCTKRANTVRRKKTTCGILLHTDCGYVMCHPYGRDYGYGNYDIPKGCLGDGETPWECAKRELMEETGIDLGAGGAEELGFEDLGRHAYNKSKDIHVFLGECPDGIDLSKMRCSSLIDEGVSAGKPEVDSYIISHDAMYLFESLRRVVGVLPGTEWTETAFCNFFEEAKRRYSAITGKPVEELKDDKRFMAEALKALPPLHMRDDLDAFAVFCNVWEGELYFAIERGRHPVYSDPSVLLLYYALTAHQSHAVRNWPYDSELLKQILRDLGISEDVIY